MANVLNIDKKIAVIAPKPKRVGRTALAQGNSQRSHFAYESHVKTSQSCTEASPGSHVRLGETGAPVIAFDLTKRNALLRRKVRFGFCPFKARERLHRQLNLVTLW
jgi:hypothetical protein